MQTNANKRKQTQTKNKKYKQIQTNKKNKCKQMQTNENKCKQTKTNINKQTNKQTINNKQQNQSNKKQNNKLLKCKQRLPVLLLLWPQHLLSPRQTRPTKIYYTLCQNILHSTSKYITLYVKIVLPALGGGCEVVFVFVCVCDVCVRVFVYMCEVCPTLTLTLTLMTTTKRHYPNSLGGSPSPLTTP